MNIYIVTYYHRHGISTGLVKCNRNPSEEEIVAAFPGWEVQLDRDDEYIECDISDEPILIP